MAISCFSWKTLVSLTLLVLLFLSDSCIATRPGRTMMTVTVKDEVDHVSAMALKYFQEKQRVAADGLYFTRLPKGVPIPPSAPSNRHNSLPQD
ncbi:hypothetical protein Sango_1096100 [Sesamum angolense]|uniref:Uncharacterized protein n=1 Tax=Sesamum angolense TaxID=2727404 RepID=A0AAE1WUR9_9LAMI|nr:hypothetical protein Sango_1096100 [Sesamum angolense]